MTLQMGMVAINLLCAGLNFMLARRGRALADEAADYMAEGDLAYDRARDFYKKAHPSWSPPHERGHCQIHYRTRTNQQGEIS